MRLSSLSLIYIALCAFVVASMLVVHMNHAQTVGLIWSNTFGLSNDVPVNAAFDPTLIVDTRTAIEM